MALIACKDCGHKISKRAESCPSCGAKQRRTSLGTKLVAALVLPALAIAIVVGATSEPPPASTPTATKTPEEQARDRRLNIAAIAVKHLRDGMHDPRSFELEQALVMDGGAGCYTYRAKNGFGALRRGQALYTPDGKLFNSDADAFAGQWNRHCGGKRGEDITAIVKMTIL